MRDDVIIVNFSLASRSRPKHPPAKLQWGSHDRCLQTSPPSAFRKQVITCDASLTVVTASKDNFEKNEQLDERLAKSALSDLLFVRIAA